MCTAKMITTENTKNTEDESYHVLARVLRYSASSLCDLNFAIVCGVLIGSKSQNMTAIRFTLDNIVSAHERGRVPVGYITQIAWSPDGTVLAVAHGSGVSLWHDGFGGAPTGVLDHPAPVKSIAFSPDSKVLATGSSDTQVRLWLLASGTSLFVMRGHTDTVNSVAISPNGRVVASGSADHTIRLVDLMDSRGLTPLLGHNDAVKAVGFTADTQSIITGSADGTIRVWAHQAAEPIVTHTYEDGVRAFAVSPDGGSLAAALKNGRLIVSGVMVNFLHWGKDAHDGGVDCVAFSPDGSLIVTGGRDHAVKIWDAATGDLLTTLETHTKPVLSVAFNPAGTMLVSASGDNQVVLWGVS